MESSSLLQVKVFPLIRSLKNEIIKTIDSPLTWVQLTASDINFAIVRPLVFKYARLNNTAVVYAALVVRSYFQAESDDDLAYSAVNHSRAMLCEILAMKLLACFASDYLQLIAVLTTSWNPLSGASQNVIDQVRIAMGGSDEYPASALEMAISTRAKDLLSAPTTQHVVNDIWSGRVVFSMKATHSVLADNYKHRPIEIYDCRNAPFLDHYRLRVPKYGAILEFLNFAVLMATFLLCLFNRDNTQLTFWEVVFIIEAVALTLEEYTASTEHGWIIYIANMWNVFDTSFLAVFFIYLALRIRGLANDDPGQSDLAFDVLACGACILFPRLAFFAVSNTVVVLSLRAMISEFVFFLGIACICFSGILFTLWTLGKEKWTIKAIAWLMVQIWFGNTYLSFAQAASFHPIFGPILMTIFAALSNTLLLTILISILSNTVARIDANATQEHLFQFAISTMEGVKSDALFSYQLPFNILAFLILKPASFILTPRKLHSLNVLLIKLTSFPILIVIALYERYWASGQILREHSRGAAHTFYHSLPRGIKHMPIVEALVGSTSADLYEAIFDAEDGADDEGLFADGYDSDDALLALRSFPSRENVAGRRGSPSPGARRRRISKHSLSHTTHSVPASHNTTPLGSPRRRPNLALDPSSPDPPGTLPLPSTKSPLARLFSRDPPPASASTTAVPGLTTAQLEASIKKIETLVDDIRDLPVQKLKDEMKELQERQARIESLLMMLTRGMRNDPPVSPRRHETVK